MKIGKTVNQKDSTAFRGGIVARTNAWMIFPTTCCAAMRGGWRVARHRGADPRAHTQLRDCLGASAFSSHRASSAPAGEPCRTRPRDVSSMAFVSCASC
jgi:hypothetical protein